MSPFEKSAEHRRRRDHSRRLGRRRGGLGPGALGSAARSEGAEESSEGYRQREEGGRDELRLVPRPGGKGDGPAAAALPPPKPANWTSAAVQKETDGEIFWKMSNGRGAMPPWKHLPEKDRWELVNYIRTLKGK